MNMMTRLSPLGAQDPVRQLVDRLFDGGLFNGSLQGDDRARLPVDSLPPGWERSNRNAPCPCGSGRKFKHCHGALI